MLVTDRDIFNPLYINHERASIRQSCCRLIDSICVSALLCTTAYGQILHIEDARSQYIHATPRDSISALQASVDSGNVKLAFDASFGYLPSLLKELHISQTAQVVVFSKTSVQKELISPDNPRSIYFNDSTYVGYVPGAKALEICTAEPYLGAVYYTLLQREVSRPRFFRTVDACLECHTDKAMSHLPQHIMYSSRCQRDGSLISQSKPMPVSDTTPLLERFGGWYVTGELAGQASSGNMIFNKKESPAELDVITLDRPVDLTKVVDSRLLMTPFSDVVALMTFAHQQHLLNLITDATYQTNSALARNVLDSRRNTYAGISDPETSSQTIRRVCEPVVQGLLFADEAQLAGQISGDSGYAQYFASLGPKDRRGRSLRTFDLKRRVFRYPCSYLIYSAAFDALPAPAMQYVYRRMKEVLSGRDTSKRFSRLTAEDRKAIREILTDTKPGFTDSGK